MKYWVLALLVVGLSFGLAAGDAVAKDGAVEVDLSKSSVKWRGEKMLGDAHWGEVDIKSAQLELKEGVVTGGEFVIDLNSISVANIEGKWEAKFLGHIKSGDFFEIEKYPTAKLVINEIVGDKASGLLTIKKKTEPVEIAFQHEGNVYQGTFMVDRTKFGVNFGSNSIFKKLVADKIINDEFKIDFTITLAE